MSVTVANIITNMDSYIGDTSNDRISAAERLQYITEAVVWLQNETGNDHQNATYTLNYLDTVHYYKVTTAIADLLDVADLRREEDDHTVSFVRKSPRELAEEIGQEATESSFAIERRDGNAYLVVNHTSKHPADVVSSLESTTADGGTWAVDSTNSDATNLTVDNVEFKEGNGSLNFDIDVSQSANNRATIQNSTLTALDLSDYLDLGSWLFWMYVPDVTNFTSVTLYWGSSTSDYWSATVTTDINGSAWVNEWNEVKINWANATKTGSPDETAIDFIRFDLNYGAGQADDTDFRLDYLRIARPEKLKFHYISWNVGTNSGGTDITAFTATSDIPYFSGQYDQYKYIVAHKAASAAFFNLRLREEALAEERAAIDGLNKIKQIIPSSRAPEVKSFKVMGVNFNRKRIKRT